MYILYIFCYCLYFFQSIIFKCSLYIFFNCIHTHFVALKDSRAVTERTANISNLCSFVGFFGITWTIWWTHAVLIDGNLPFAVNAVRKTRPITNNIS